MGSKKTLFTGLLWLLILFLALLFFNSPGTTDVDIWRSWTSHARDYGIVEGFAQNQADYPPLATVFLWGAMKLCRLFGIVSLFDAIKISILVFLFATLLTFRLLTRDLLATLLLCGAVFLNSMGLGYIDIYFAPFLIIALWALKEKRWLMFSVFFTLACLVKWQPVIITPFIALYLLSITRISDWRAIPIKTLLVRVILPAVVIGLGFAAVFGIVPIWQAFRASLSHHYLSGNALNFNWILTHLLHVLDPNQFGGLINGKATYIVTDSFPITIGSRLLFIGIYSITLVAFFRREKSYENFLLYTLTGFLAYFTFNIGVHENHLFLAAVLACLLLWVDRRHWLAVILIILMTNINLYAFYGVSGIEPSLMRVIGGKLDVALPLSVYNVIFFLCFWASTVFYPRPKAEIETNKIGALR